MSIGIIGFGRIGAMSAFELLGKGHNIKCYDVIEQTCRAHMLDLRHAYPNMSIEFCKVEEMIDCSAIIMTAGVPRKPNQTRADLFRINKKIALSIIEKLNGFEGSFITVTNPADAINTVVSQTFDDKRCFGFGSLIDSARLRVITKNMSDFVIGEHGELFVPIVSDKHADRDAIVKQIKRDNLYLIENKKGTEFGPVKHIANLANDICKNSEFETIASVYCNGEYGIEGISIGVPIQISHGKLKSINEINLDDWEESRFKEGVDSIRRTISTS